MLVSQASFRVQAFCGDVHLGLSGNVNVTVGPVGRDASASMCMGRKGYAMVYSYSCSRGAFMGMSIDGTVTHTRANANLAFYGRPLTAKDLLLGGSVDAPPAARSLYSALDTMITSFAYSELQRGGLRCNRSWLGASGTAQLESLGEQDTGTPGDAQKGGASTSVSLGASVGTSSTVIVPAGAAPGAEHSMAAPAHAWWSAGQAEEGGGQAEQPQLNLLDVSQASIAAVTPPAVQDLGASGMSRARSEEDGYSLNDLFD